MNILEYMDILEMVPDYFFCRIFSVDFDSKLRLMTVIKHCELFLQEINMKIKHSGLNICFVQMVAC